MNLIHILFSLFQITISVSSRGNQLIIRLFIIDQIWSRVALLMLVFRICLFFFCFVFFYEEIELKMKQLQYKNTFPSPHSKLN